MVVGWITPVILVPVSAFTSLTPDQLRTILAHELSHIRRYDHLVNMFKGVIEIILFFHPTGWWISKQLQRERENCCKDSTIRVTGNAKTLAEALVRMESLRLANPTTALAANGGPLMNRITRMLGVQVGRSTSTGWRIPIALALGAVILAGGLEGQVAALTQRLATLEDGETIARLAQAGSEEVAKKEIKSALDRVGDPQADPKDRLAALQRLRLARQKNGAMIEALMGESEMRERDVVLPMLELARDTTLDSEYRADVLRNCHGSRVEELRQPLLDMLASNDVAAVRVEALTGLFWHLDEAAVRETIRETAQQDPHEAVQARAARILPKVRHIEHAAARSAGSTDGVQER